MSAGNLDAGGPEPIAIVGMACRFPGAGDVNAFWRNLRDGVESIRHFSVEELRAAGVDPGLLARPNYVRANAVLDDAERFDAAFFGYTPREAELLDPQQRIFLECAWAALEHAGWNPQAVPGATGVFAGAGINTYLLRQIAPNAAAVKSAGDFAVMIANDKDYLATRVAYKLGLRGPAVAVQTACSTSLVAVHLAVQSLLAGECDTAIAGGVSVRFPQTAGYLHGEGMILSGDGHCRAFDAAASGTVGGSGAGAVILRRLADALEAGETIHALILGSAVNNDGSAKLGYTAPSVEGQEAVIAEALAVAGVDPGAIGYVEAHGTGTRLGDPVEVAALTRAFRRGTDRRQFCALGSVKTNFGHLDAAAGVAGLIKAALALRHAEIPPSLHFTQANPEIDFAASPFRVAAALAAWPAGSTPRRAGVSSFGIGGTNAHVVLQEPPAAADRTRTNGPELLVLSARTEGALARAAHQLAAAIEAPDTPLGDVAYTLAVGRREFECRRFVVARTGPEAAAALRRKDSGLPPAAEAGELEQLGRSWAEGATVDWNARFAGQDRRRVPLPTYPFEGGVCWIQGEAARKRELADWFYLPSWTAAPTGQSLPAVTEGAWLVFGGGLGAVAARRLRAAGATVFEGPAGPDYRDALVRAKSPGLRLRWILHTGNVGSGGTDGFADLLSLVHALGKAELDPGVRLVVAADGLCGLPGEESVRPERSLLLGPVRVLSRELTGMTARAVDVRWLDGGDAAIDALLAEARRDGPETLVALRGRERWLPTAAPVRLDGAPCALRDRGVYLITGGLGGIGGVLARDLAARCHARLVLTGRTPLPERERWNEFLAAHRGADSVADRIRLVLAIEAAGGEVLTGCADAGDEAAMRRVVDAARARFGEIHGVIHAAGLPGGGAMLRRTAAEAAGVLAPKVSGARILESIFRGVPLDFFVLMSSLSAQLGEFGQADYAAANAFLEAFASTLHAAGWPAVAVAWDAWRDSGMAARVAALPGLAEWAAARRPFQIGDEEGVEVFYRALSAGTPRVIVSTQDLATRMAEETPAPAVASVPSPAASPRQAEAAAGTGAATAQALTAIWEELIGVTPIGLEDNFFELGGHSLLAGQVIARVQERWGVILGLAAFFEMPTIAELARWIDARTGATGGPPLVPAARTGPLPLSYQQRALWLLDRMEGGSAHMNELGAQTIRGPLDPDLLQRSLSEVVRRHEVLRTRFVEGAGEPAQEVLPAQPVDLVRVDLATRPPTERDAAVRELAAQLAAQPFDLARGPLLRATLARLAPDHHVLIVVVHHIVFDGWSSGIFFREMCAHYVAGMRNGRPDVPVLAVQYADYAVWQRAALAGSGRAALETYWRDHLRVPLPVLALPTDRPRPPRPNFRGRKHAVRIEPSLRKLLEREAQAGEATVFMTLLAAYAALLGRYAGQDEVVVGCPAAGRSRREVEPLVGFFINPLPVRVDLGGSPNFTTLLERVRTAVLGAHEHQALPFELVVEAARPSRDPARHPVFQTQFIYQGAVPELPSVPGLAIEPLEWPEGPARTDLDLYLWEAGEEIRGYFIYDTALFEASTVARMTQRWLALLEQAAARPQTPLADLKLDRAVELPRFPRVAPRGSAA